MDRLPATHTIMLEYYRRCRCVQCWIPVGAGVCLQTNNQYTDAVADLSTSLLLLGREAEQYRAEEEAAAVVLQACWRGCLQRKEIEQLG